MFVDKLNMSRIALPKVSVVMPAYNVEQYIAHSIESVLASDYPNIELIIVDDGSTDTTFAIAQGYAANDSRVVALTKSNGDQPLRHPEPGLRSRSRRPEGRLRI